MKRKLSILVIAVMLLSAGCVFLTACGGSAQESSSTTETTEEETTGTDVPKSEQTGTAGSNIPLKDNHEEAENQVKIAMQNLIKETYGDKVDDARINEVKIYTAEDEQANEILKTYNLGPDEVAFEVGYDLHPAEGTDVNELLAATGEYDEESGWVINKFNLGVLRPTEDGSYTITDFGTGW